MPSSPKDIEVRLTQLESAVLRLAETVEALKLGNCVGDPPNCSGQPPNCSGQPPNCSGLPCVYSGCVGPPIVLCRVCLVCGPYANCGGVPCAAENCVGVPVAPTPKAKTTRRRAPAAKRRSTPTKRA
jgi:hypothetical protein